MKVEICIAIFDEEATLFEQITKLMHFLESEFFYAKKVDFSVIIADNGSRDSSLEIALSLASKYKNVSVLSEDKCGVGRVLKRAWSESKADFVGYMDLDLATDLRHIAQAITLLESGADIVAANRLDVQSQVLNRTFKREFLSKSFNRIANFVLKTSFADGQCGFKFLRRQMAQKLLSTKSMSDGLFFASQILIFGEWLGAKISQMPVTWVDSPSSKIRLFSFSIECLREIFKTKKLKNKVLKL